MLNEWQEKKQPTGVDEKVGMFDNWEQTNKQTYWGWWEGWNVWQLRTNK